MADAVAADYRAVIEAVRDPRATDRRTLGRLRRSLRAIRARDYFPPPEREEALRAVEELTASAEVAR